MNTKEEKYFQKLGAKIKQLREEKEIGKTQLYMIEKGRTNPRLLTLMKIANGLEISIDELLRD